QSLKESEEFLIIDVFHSYAKSDGDCQRLSKTELKKLLQQEFRNALEVRSTIISLPIYSVSFYTLEKIRKQIDIVSAFKKLMVNKQIIIKIYS
uniref:S100/CaBP-9k-type calcium binding subdomain domain-containing protein n=1 Tax=Catagonus wagneri TaxID=51154 RepID=A0A8C3VUH3_9CETA